ncbi:uncharacterized protein LOC142976495 [Anticarsia gemmatalis]|uniref:uncharacterized protein LOC142976495 n=1 Tax=Anticarsia gemmatalis TaxID=129554 RepID=UPI003F76C3EC
MRGISIPITESRQRLLLDGTIKHIFVAVQFITLKANGKQYLVKDGYTYYKKDAMKHGYRWKCTTGCGSYLIRAHNGTIKKVYEKHKHAKPKLLKLDDGKYLKCEINNIESQRQAASYEKWIHVL